SGTNLLSIAISPRRYHTHRQALVADWPGHSCSLPELPCDHSTLPAGQIVRYLQHVEPRLFQHRRHLPRLPERELERQDPPGLEHPPRLLDDGAHHDQPILSPVERNPRLVVPHLRSERAHLARRYVWRIGNDRRDSCGVVEF